MGVVRILAGGKGTGGRAGADKRVARARGRSSVGARAGLVGTIVGVAAAGLATGLAVERYAMWRVRGSRSDQFAAEPFALLPADRELTVYGEDNGEIHVEIVEPRGGGEPAVTMVFVHGFCLDMGTWHFQRRHLPALVGSDVRMVYYDQPGHGRSGRKPSGDYSINELGRDLRMVLDAVAPTGPLILAGHSMGAMTAMALAEQWPEFVADRVLGVAMISSSAGDLDSVALGLPEPVARVRKQLTPALSTALRVNSSIVDGARRIGSDVAWLLTKRYAFTEFDADPALVSYVEQMIAATPMEVIAGYLRTLSEHDRYAALEVFDGIETLIAVAEDDLLTPIDHAREMADLLPAAELVELANGGHLGLMAHFEVVNAQLAALVARARRAEVGRTASAADRAQADRARAKKADQAGRGERRTFRRARKVNESRRTTEDRRAADERAADERAAGERKAVDPKAADPKAVDRKAVVRKSVDRKARRNSA